MRSITIECPDCSRTMLIDRDRTDPSMAVRLRLQCDQCDDGDFHSPEYVDADGWPVPAVEAVA